MLTPEQEKEIEDRFDMIEDGDYRCKICGKVFIGTVYRGPGGPPFDDFEDILLPHLIAHEKEADRVQGDHRH